MTPGQPPTVGTSSVMKGKHNAAKWPGYDPHGVVKIMSIDLGSH
jgi:hypothetical protein